MLKRLVGFFHHVGKKVSFPFREDVREEFLLDSSPPAIQPLAPKELEAKVDYLEWLLCDTDECVWSMRNCEALIQAILLVAHLAPDDRQSVLTALVDRQPLIAYDALRDPLKGKLRVLYSMIYQQLCDIS